MSEVRSQDVLELAKRCLACMPIDLLRAVDSIYGVPSGGSSAAFAFASVWTKIAPTPTPKIVDSLADHGPATLIVDDVFDSGKTLDPFLSQGKLCAVLLASHAIDKRSELTSGQLFFGAHLHKAAGYAVFPWERKLGTYEVEGPEDAVRRILQFLGHDPDEPSLRETPRRVLSWLGEFREGQDGFDATTFDGVTYGGMVLVIKIPFVSLCEHHLIPFIGTASVAYIPKAGIVIGLSKLARFVHQYARRLQVQERMTEQICEAIKAATDTEDVAVLVKAEHECMAYRGPRVPGAITITSSLSGEFMQDAKVREEFMRLAHG